MARVLCLPTTPAEIAYIAQHLRPHDVQELQAMHGDDVEVVECLRRAVAVSEEVFTAWTLDGQPMALYGVAPVSLLGGQGCPWMLATDVVQGFPRDIVRLGKQRVGEWSRRYDQLFNYVDARNLRSIAWLKRIGFVVFDAHPHGAQGLPFRRFERCT